MTNYYHNQSKKSVKYNSLWTVIENNITIFQIKY